VPIATWEASTTMEGRRPSRWWYALLALPLVGLLYPPLYATRDPELAGIPFFYWYQFAWVIAAAIITLVVFLATRRR
jgi:Na+/melibiose symporter-like transporter